MAILKVANLGHPVLRERAVEVDVDEIRTGSIQNLIDDLIATMREYDGAGLAAPQVHHSRRIVVFETKSNPRYPEAPDIPLTVAINPEITPLTDQTQGMWEGCLSVPRLRGYVERPNRIKFRALDREGQRFERICEGFEAIVTQHECDHLDGVLYLDRISDTRKLAFLDEFHRYHSPGN